MLLKDALLPREARTKGSCCCVSCCSELLICPKHSNYLHLLLQLISSSHLNATHYATRKYLALVNKNRIFSIQN